MSDEWARVREALARDPERARQWARIVGASRAVEVEDVLALWDALELAQEWEHERFMATLRVVRDLQSQVLWLWLLLAILGPVTLVLLAVAL